MQHMARQPDHIPLTPGTRLPFRGEEHELVWPEGRGRTRLRTGDAPGIESPGDLLTFPDRIRSFLKREAKADLTEAVNRHAERLGVVPDKISLRDTTSRWGSCSSRRTLSFSWRLILAPPEILDYVAAHEVAHLLQMNHSKAFWSLVEESYGPHTHARDWLHTHGQRLHSFGRGGLAGG